MPFFHSVLVALIGVGGRVCGLGGSFDGVSGRVGGVGGILTTMDSPRHIGIEQVEILFGKTYQNQQSFFLIPIMVVWVFWVVSVWIDISWCQGLTWTWYLIHSQHLNDPLKKYSTSSTSTSLKRCVSIETFCSTIGLIRWCMQGEVWGSRWGHCIYVCSWDCWGCNWGVGACSPIWFLQEDHRIQAIGLNKVFQYPKLLKIQMDGFNTMRFFGSPWIMSISNTMNSWQIQF